MGQKNSGAGGAAAGAVIGAVLGGPVGALIGGLIGGAATQDTRSSPKYSPMPTGPRTSGDNHCPARSGCE